MGAVSTSLVEEARTVFRDLGYELTAEGGEFRAERKWRTVYVTTADPEEANTHGRLRCFVTRAERAAEVRDRLLAIEPDYDWAVIGIDEDGEYRVTHPSADVLPAP
ncbi:MAG: hypothetical protein RI560_11120 [Natronomonas sp.]|jgi:hypothetical protein|uniref:DUF7116 family protein n=1 Tax=Natronomonas sp. TaxID=2184060 RepID=UPI0028706366|nr:hypothetical protein [Natronomonas sp.]MDR9382201.1 hypothetical protein [Natronomonas sp.]MDR9429763.1 hypothetical protein [Natronomonas sp.]